MPPTELNSKPVMRLRKSQVALLLLGGVLVWSVIGITGYFRLGSETLALRRALMNSVGGEWDKKLAVRVGRLTLGLVQFGCLWVPMPPEARAGVGAIRGAEVGVYQVKQAPERLDSQRLLRAADRAVKGLGWERVVGVARDGALVVVYLPGKGLSPTRVACCVAVLAENKLVVVSARGNPEPLLEMAAREASSRGMWPVSGRKMELAEKSAGGKMEAVP